jgi:hypothetical protein
MAQLAARARGGTLAEFIRYAIEVQAPRTIDPIHCAPIAVEVPCWPD